MGLLDYEKLMGDPMLQMGLGILAANNGQTPLGSTLGRGALSGMDNLAKFQQMQQRKQILEQQQAQQQRENTYNDRALELKQQELQQKLAGGGADPYFSPYDADTGAYTFNHRTGQFQPATVDGKPIVKAANSPYLQGAVQGAKSEAQAAWKPNADIPGMVSTDRDVAAAARGLPTNNFGTPYPVTFGAPGTTRTDGIEGTANFPDLRNPAKPRGIQVPTPEESAAAQKAAIIRAENAVKAQSDLPQYEAEANGMMKLVDDLVSHPGYESAVGLSSKLDPRNFIPGTDAMDFKLRLKQLEGKQFLQAFESLKGGGQITQIEGEKATAAIARMNTAASEGEFKKAAEEFKGIVQDGLNRAQKKAGGTVDAKSFEDMPKASQYKGKIIRDTVTGKRLKSNGMSWVEVKE
jgi:hypothetical protein